MISPDSYVMMTSWVRAYQQHPALITAAYSCFVLGNALTWPAVVGLAQLVSLTRPALATWAGCLVVCGLFTRTFHGGIDHLALQLVTVQGLGPATDAVASSYAAWHVFRAGALAIMAGWIVLAVGAYLSGAMPLWRAVALGLMSALALGTLKGTEIPQSLIAIAGLSIALVPTGVRLLTSRPRPSRRAMIWLGVSVAVTVLLLTFGPTN